MMERMISVLIVDDDDGARNILEKFLALHSNVKLVDSVNNAASAMAVVETYEPALIFLDINMPHEDGLFFARKLKESEYDSLVVFTTAYRNYAIHAFELKPLDYLVKPFGQDEISNVLFEIEKKMNEIHPDSSKVEWGSKELPMLKFRVKKGFKFVHPNDILYIKSLGGNSELVLTSKKEIWVNQQISEICATMGRFGFLNINRSNLVNIRYITKIDRKERMCFLQFNDEEFDFTISRSKLNVVEQIKSIKLG